MFEQIPSKELLREIARRLRSSELKARDLERMADYLEWVASASNHDMKMRDKRLKQDQKAFDIRRELDRLVQVDSKTREEALETMASPQPNAVGALKKWLQRHPRKGLFG
jgi:hypothetical protein